VVSARERVIVAAATLATAATRLLAISKTLWDWDEALFVLALREYDVTLHHPHPPGFPLYILSAKVFQLVGVPEFQALQTINVLASIAIVPVAFLFARALRFSFATSLTAALFLAFFPNVWFFGGTAFSDVPSMVLVLLASALFLRGETTAGAIVLGIAAGYRPQNLLVGAVPLLLAGKRIQSIAITGLITAGAYLAAAQLSGGWSRYAAAVAAHQQYIATHDSIGAASRPPLRYLVDDFFAWPFRAPAINVTITLLVAIGLIAAVVRRNRSAWVAIATFGPLAILSFLMLDWVSASRFSIGYIPLMAVLAAYGLEIATMRFATTAAALILAMMFAWTLPLLREVRSIPSPPAAAVKAIPPNGMLYVSAPLEATARALMPSRSFRVLDPERIPADVLLGQDALFFREGGGQFVRQRDRLARVARDRYFDVSVAPLSEYIRLDGKTIALAPVDGIGRLTIQTNAGASPITIRFNGRVIATDTARVTVHQFRVPSRTGVNRVVVEGDVQITAVGWEQAARL
jgi:hypothetical protein